MQENILGYLLIKPELASTVDESIFVTESHKKLFQAIVAQISANKATDILTLKEKTGLDGSFLAGLSNKSTIMTDKSLSEHVDMARKKMQSDAFLAKVSKQVTDIQNTIVVDERYEKARELKQAVQEHSLDISKHTVETNPELVETFIEDYQKPVEVVRTGLRAIDLVTGGLRKGNFVTVLANSGVGKTNLLLNMAADMLHHKKKVLFFSLEMSTYEILERLFSIIGQHRAQEIRDRAQPIEQLHETAEKIKGLDLYVISTSGVTSSDVIETATQLCNDVGIDVVMVDYLQRLNDTIINSDYERITSMCRRLKNAAMALQVPIITPSQVDKQSAKGSHIAVENAVGSKAIGDESDLSLYLFRKEKNSHSGLGTNEAELWLKVVKNRHGETGTATQIDFDKQTLRMGIPEHAEVQEGESAWSVVDAVDTL